MAARPSTPNRISFPPAIERVDPSKAFLLLLATMDDDDRSAALLSVVLMIDDYSSILIEVLSA